MIPKSWFVLGPTAAVVAVVGCLAAILGRGGDPRCDMDGLLLFDRSHVTLVTNEGEEHRFCSLACAETWAALSRSRLSKVRVADERSGTMIDAADAYFVRSQITSPSANGERRHAFASAADAAAHAESHRGRVLEGAESPFARYRALTRAARRPSRQLRAEAPRETLDGRASPRNLSEEGSSLSNGPAAAPSEAAEGRSP